MAHKSLVVCLIIRFHTKIFHEFQHCRQIILIFSAAKQAVQLRYRDQGVGPSGKESSRRFSVFSAADRVLRFVAVSPRVFHSNDRFHDDRVRHSRCLFRLFRQEQVFHAADAF